MDARSFPRWTLQSNAVAGMEKLYADMAAQGLKFTRPTPSFGFHGSSFQLPHWPIVIFTAAIFATLLILRNRQLSFSLRTLLIATALVAVGLGLVVAAGRF
jgi:hypothetical protein